MVGTEPGSLLISFSFVKAATKVVFNAVTSSGDARQIEIAAELEQLILEEATESDFSYNSPSSSASACSTSRLIPVAKFALLGFSLEPKGDLSEVLTGGGIVVGKRY